MPENLLTEDVAQVAGSCCGGGSCSTAPVAEAGTRAVYVVKGMTCGHCAGSVTAELKRIAGVTAVAVDLATGVVTVDSEQPLDRAAVAEAIDEAGYELV
ncbi:heavy-metal-associated domain-containing protein [Kitasatospora sp. NPDC001175]|uniref:heavy-metal-associated domain-containing protein n=1 Tax=Kitasatospora sp. NPDC001175 TaxID=3157103 RepID=UPI003CFC83BE